MHSLSRSSPYPDRWVYCLIAVAEVAERLPLLYRIVERGDDDVRIELHLSWRGPLEVLRFRGGGRDRIVGSLGPHLERDPSGSFPAWLAEAIGGLASDLEWAASRDCAEQASEILSGLIRFRVAAMREELRHDGRSLIERARVRLRG
ncbi:MAG TPA: hypothetical protein VFW02_02420 [Candidatus Limnocylindrales bacterium]|nr:hypothetical protein [Candidatus Limnocylindrales bacterium]